MTPTFAVRVRDLPTAQAALAEAASRGIEIELVSEPWLAGFGGVGFIHALELELGRTVTVDCGDKAGDAMAALRCGSRSLLFGGDAAVAARLADMAGQLGGTVRNGVGLPELACDDFVGVAAAAAIATHGVGRGPAVVSPPPE